MTENKALLNKLTALLNQAYDQGIATSLSVGISFYGQKLHLHKGETAKHPLTQTSDQTLYDLASLTKILGTTVAVAKAISDGRIQLEEKPFACWPQVSMGHLLAHTSGLKAHAKFYLKTELDWAIAKNRQKIYAALMAETASPAGDRLYSDLGFIALGFLLEQRLQKPLYEIFCDAWKSLGLGKPFTFFPTSKTMGDDPNIAPTGVCPLRHQLIRGQVHDPNCFYLGGIFSHAGLFGRLSAVLMMGEFFLSCLKNPKNEIETLIGSFARAGLGFDRQNVRGSMQNLSPFAFGHFGYTGTSLWIDPERQGLVIALLTNRVNCSEQPEGIFWLRKRLTQTIVRSW